MRRSKLAVVVLLSTVGIGLSACAEAPPNPGPPADLIFFGNNIITKLVQSIDHTDLGEELAGRSHAARARLAYLVSGVAPDLASILNVASAGKVWFGPRAKTRRHNARWNIADTILPISPAELGGR